MEKKEKAEGILNILNHGVQSGKKSVGIARDTIPKLFRGNFVTPNPVEARMVSKVKKGEEE